MHTLLNRHARWTTVPLLLMLATGCGSAMVIVPRDGDYRYAERDTLYGRLKDKDVRVTFRHVVVSRVDTVTRWRTIYRDGSRVDTVVVVDTVRVGPGGRRPFPRTDTVRVVVRDTIRVVDTVRVGPDRRPIRPRVDTVRIVVRDTVRVPDARRPGTPDGPIIMPPPPPQTRVDTVRIVVRDTVRITVRDTLRQVDTVRVRGQRVLFVPPGQYPPEGECRVWIHDQPPGQQARPAACDALGPIPAGAFILYGGEAWDFDYDWVTMGGAPAPILALKRQQGRSGAGRPTPPGSSIRGRPTTTRPRPAGP